MESRIDTSASAELAERLGRSMPAGDTRTGTYFDPYPIALARGQGFCVWDVDGNEYLDFVNNNTAMIHGHAHPDIVAAITAQAKLGTGFPAPHPLQADVAERIRGRIASIEHLRFTNSGTEAVMMAIRAARAFTGRDELVKVLGAYHGSWEQVPMRSGAEPGIPDASDALVHMVEIGDVVALRALVERRGSNIAAILIDPLGPGFGGPVEFFRAARELATSAGALLVFDEVVSARLAFGGWQSVVNVWPDLTTLGKIIAGGLPGGAFGGRADVMAAFDPRVDRVINHNGTFNGNPITMAAGRVSLDLLTADEIARINALGERLATGVRTVLADAQIDATVQSNGSLVHFMTADPTVIRDVHTAALDEGLYMTHRGLLNISTPMDDATVDDGLDRFSRAALRAARTAVA